MFEKKRLLRQFALPIDQRQAFLAQWTRQPDLFGDGFQMSALVGEDRIDFHYFHVVSSTESKDVWKISLSLHDTGRAKVERSVGVFPEIKTIQRAAAIVGQTLLQMQANPIISPAIDARAGETREKKPPPHGRRPLP